MLHIIVVEGAGRTTDPFANGKRLKSRPALTGTRESIDSSGPISSYAYSAPAWHMSIKLRSRSSEPVESVLVAPVLARRNGLFRRDSDTCLTKFRRSYSLRW